METIGPLTPGLSEPNQLTIEELAKRHPPGHVGVASGFLGRYREFDFCLARTISPPGSSFQYYLGVDVSYNFNSMVRHFMKNPDFKWLWILGDDHVWNPELLFNLLERNVDVVVPLSVRRLYPYIPIIHTEIDHGCVSLKDPWEPLKGKTGLFAWEGTSGNGGMLIRRHVLEAMTDPYFENGQTATGVGASDLHFWHKLHKHGFTPYLDLDNLIGHLSHMAVWPKYNEETGEWKWEVIAP